MIWWFDRGTETVSCEARRRDAHYEMVMHRPDGREIVHVAHSAAELIAVLENAPRHLIAIGWQPRIARQPRPDPTAPLLDNIGREEDKATRRSA